MTPESERVEPEWASIPPDIRSSIVAAWSQDVPVAATALHGRWWQLETWLRSLVYVELRAAYGAVWADCLPSVSKKRKDADQKIDYMATPDSQARLAYTNVSGLFGIIDKHWELFEPSLFDQNIWRGRVEELRHIRNRIGHCRRPHADDLGRLEQTLRDLEVGAFRALLAFNRQAPLDERRDDPMVDAWVCGGHEAANRLIDHADRQYETSFSLHWSRRPWSERPTAKSWISGKKGYIWHAHWFFRGDRRVDLRRFWNDGYLDINRESVLFVCSSNSSFVEISFSALEDPDRIADVIGCCFDTILTNLKYTSDTDDDYLQWTKQHDDLDPRVQVGGPWSIVDDSTTPITIFAA